MADDEIGCARLLLPGTVLTVGPENHAADRDIGTMSRDADCAPARSVGADEVARMVATRTAPVTVSAAMMSRNRRFPAILTSL